MIAEDRNAVTHEIIAKATGGIGHAAIGGGVQDLYFRKPVFRKGGWMIRNTGWVEIKSWRKAGSCFFLSTDWHYYGFSKEIQNVGALPDWFDHSLMRTSCHLYKEGTNRNRALWANVETYHIAARYYDDLPKQFRQAEAA